MAKQRPVQRKSRNSAQTVNPPSEGSGRETESKAKRTRVWGIIFAIFLTSTSVGFAIGRARSPEYSRGDKAYSNILDWTFERVTVRDSRWQVSGNFVPGEKTAIHLVGGTIEFLCAAKSHKHDLVTGVSKDDPVPSYTVQCSRDRMSYERSSVEEDDAELFAHSNNRSLRASHRLESLLVKGATTDLPPLSIEAADLNTTPHRKGLTFEGVLLVIAGAKEMGNVRGTSQVVWEYWILRKSRSLGSKIRDVTMMVGAAVSGFALGYYLGYEDDPDCSATLFDTQLQQPKLWADLGQRLMRFYSFEFTSAVAGNISQVTTPDHRSLTFRDVYLPLRAAKLIDCSFGPITLSSGLGDTLYQASTGISDDGSFLAATVRLFIPPKIPKEYFGVRWWVHEKDGGWKPLPLVYSETSLSNEE